MVTKQYEAVIDPIALAEHSDPAAPLDDESALMWAELLTPRWEQHLDLIVYTPELEPLDIVTRYESAGIDFVWNGPDTGEFIVAEDHRLAPLLRQVPNRVIPIRAVYNGQEWNGIVTRAKLAGSGPERRYTVEITGVYAYLYSVMAQPQPLLPLAVQFPPEDFFAGPLPAVLYWFISRNFGRLGIPIALKPYDALRDTTSEWVSLVARETPLGELFEDVLKTGTAELKVGRWHRGDPQPWEGAELTEPCLTFEVIDQPKRGGLNLGTGTLLDGIARTIGRVISDLANATIGSFAPDLAERIAAELVETEAPAVIWHEGMAGVEDASIAYQHPSAIEVIVGGKSASWINKLVSMGVESAIGMAITAAGAVIPGLADAASGLLNDVFLAFQKFTDHEAAAQLGTWVPREAFKGGGSSAFTFDSNQIGRTGLHENAGSASAAFTAADGHPHRAFVDYDLGALIGWEDGGDLRTDRITTISVIDERDAGIQVRPVIGADDPEDDAGSFALRKIGQIERFIKAATLNTN